MRKHLNKIIFGIIVVGILAISFFRGGNLPSQTPPVVTPENKITTQHMTADEKIEAAKEIAQKSTTTPIEKEETQNTALEENESDKKPYVEKTAKEVTEAFDTQAVTAASEEQNEIYHQKSIDLPVEKKEEPAVTQIAKTTVDEKDTVTESKEKDKKQSDKNSTEVSDGIKDIQPTEDKAEKENMTCYLSVRCDTVLNNLQHLAKDKHSIIPKGGIIYENPSAVFYEGESVFNVLLRELKKNKIHFEYEKTPMYNSVYIEGIGNLYEFDCGELSGWLYRVNGKTPSSGCSQYFLKDGDRVEFMYSCNLGIDIGGYKEISGE